MAVRLPRPESMLRTITTGGDEPLLAGDAGHPDNASSASASSGAGAGEILAVSAKMRADENAKRAAANPFAALQAAPGIVQQTSMRRGSWFGLYAEGEAEHHQPLTACKSESEVAEAFGTEVRVVGELGVKTFYGKKGNVMAGAQDWPVVYVAHHDREVMVGTCWDPATRPAPALVANCLGRTVAVRGVLHAQPPTVSDGQHANFGHYCIAPVLDLGFTHRSFAGIWRTPPGPVPPPPAHRHRHHDDSFGHLSGKQHPGRRASNPSPATAKRAMLRQRSGSLKHLHRGGGGGGGGGGEQARILRSLSSQMSMSDTPPPPGLLPGPERAPPGLAGAAAEAEVDFQQHAAETIEEKRHEKKKAAKHKHKPVGGKQEAKKKKKKAAVKQHHRPPPKRNSSRKSRLNLLTLTRATSGSEDELRHAAALMIQKGWRSKLRAARRDSAEHFFGSNALHWHSYGPDPHSRWALRNFMTCRCRSPCASPRTSAGAA